jgi:hypothetical protein
MRIQSAFESVRGSASSTKKNEQTRLLDSIRLIRTCVLIDVTYMDVATGARWSAEDLAQESAVGVTTIRRAELADGETSMTAANDGAVRRALETARVEFIDENGGGPGLRLRKPQRSKQSK